MTRRPASFAKADLTNALSAARECEGTQMSMVKVDVPIDKRHTFQSIDSAQFVREMTVADLLMGSGRVVRATWEYRGRMCAWWPAEGQRYKNPIGLYTPRGWRIVAEGMGRR